MESVVPGLELTPEIRPPEWLEEDVAENDDATVVSTDTGEWVNPLGFEIRYQGAWSSGPFTLTSSGSIRERLQGVAVELMSQVQDVVAVTTKEPWPLDVDGRRDMALANATIEGDDLHLWYGDRGSPALKLPSVHLV
jgi:hypothetical protein